MTDATPPGAARSGPWTLRCCVTAACTRCGAVPLDEDSGLTPHFDSPGQARGELPRDWGWRLTARSPCPDDDELLCPACAAADDGGEPRPPAPGTADDPEPDTAPWWERTGQATRQLPPNAAIRPAAPRAREGRPCQG